MRQLGEASVEKIGTSRVTKGHCTVAQPRGLLPLWRGQ